MSVPKRGAPGSTRQPSIHREPRWPASLAVGVALVLYVTLPERFTIGPVWLFPLMEAALLVPLTLVVPHRHGDEPRWQRALSIVLIALVNAANLASLVLLILDLAQGQKEGIELLFAAVQIWLTNVLVFGLWYWEIDRGGPSARSRGAENYPDFLFPQMNASNIAPSDWRTAYLDYLYLAFTNATAFSPTDTLPLSAWAKVLMGIQAFASLLTVALVAGRAVNILH